MPGGGGGGGPSSLKFLPGVGLGGGVKFLIYFLEGGVCFWATWKLLWLHPCRPPRNNRGQRDLSLVHHCINEMLCKTRACIGLLQSRYKRF